MKVPYTIIMLKETKDGPDFFTEVAEVADLEVSGEKAIKEAHCRYDQEDPRVKVIGILKGNFATNWIPGSSVDAS
tara:strand:- start:289 stop:513 length:225 start_codon:yes stop_codon:yes gene_type:complete